MWSFRDQERDAGRPTRTCSRGEGDREVANVNIFPRGKDRKVETLVMLPVWLRRNVLPLSRF